MCYLFPVAEPLEVDALAVVAAELRVGIANRGWTILLVRSVSTVLN